METIARLPALTPIRALRLHARHPASGTPQAVKVATLLDLGERQARRDAEGKLVTDLVAAMRKVVEGVPGSVAARLDEVAGITVELALGIAREVVGVAVDKGLVDPTPTVVRCLRDCVHGSDVGDLVVRLHPEDLELVRSRLADMTEIDEEKSRARLLADRTVPRGGVLAETGSGRLRYDPRDAVERISQEVRREVAS